MIKETKFNGLTQSPSDNECKDGDLASCLNLIPEDGALKPIQQPEITEIEGIFGSYTDNEGVHNLEGDIVYVHKVEHGDGLIHEHYIVHLTDSMNPNDFEWCWMEKGEDGSMYPFLDKNEKKVDLSGFNPNAITAVGNILCFVTDSETIYVFWNKNIYKLFRTSQFNLDVKLYEDNVTSEYVSIQEKIEEDDFWLLFDREKYHSDGQNDGKYKPYPFMVKANKVTDVYNYLASSLNKRIDELGNDYFKFATLLVAAVRLYDGNYINISPIMLLDASSALHGNSDNGYTKVTPYFSYWINRSSTPFLPYPSKSVGIQCSSGLSKFNISVDVDTKGFEGLIDGVDIFITQEESFLNLKDRILLNNPTYINNDCFFQKINIPYLEGEDFHYKFDNLPFYKAMHISNEHFNVMTQLKRIVGTENSITLANLYNKSYGGTNAITYNNRLHIANIKETVSQSSFHLPEIVKMPQEDFNEDVIDVIFLFIDDNDKEYIFTQNKFITYDYLFQPIIAIPYTDMEKLILYVKIPSYSGRYDYYKEEFKLWSSSDIGYSYYANITANGFGKINTVRDTISQSEWDEVSNKKSSSYILGSYPSLVKVSEAENPLVFPAANSVQVGSSIVNGLAANTRPISEGQFGEAPLYAFTDEGVWVLMTGANGTYEARQPVNREICSNPKGILQIDDAVLFPTERGIVMQQGRGSQLITEPLDGQPFQFLDMFKESFQQKVIAANGTQASDITYIPFREFMKNADMVYDYYSSRIIVFNPELSYAYVYSIKSGMWGMMHSDLKKRVNIYPEAYAINRDNNIVDLYQSQPVGDVPYFLCTRPVGFDDSEAFKTAFAAIVRGYFRNERGKCGMVLYGSNDKFNYHAISSSVNHYLRGMAGSPYKYFRLALIGSLSPEESLSGFSADIKERWNNKLR